MLPAPIVLIASADSSVSTESDAADIEFDQFVARPLTSSELGAAIRHSSQEATGERINAAMELAIESFVAEAMGSLGMGGMPPLDEDEEPSREGKADQESELVGGALRTREPTEVLVARDATAVLQTKKREPTQVLAHKAGDLLRIETPPHDSLEHKLKRASKELLDQVIPNETLDVDIEELDGVKEPGSAPRIHADSDEPETGGGDFARQLRLKMSAMAARLFPGQSADDNSASVAGPNTAHTEIDLREIVEGVVEDDTNAGSLSLGAPTHALVNESGITMARDAHAAAGSEPGGHPLVGEINNSDDDIANLMGRFWQSEFTGRVVIRREDEEKRIEFDRGSIVFASSGASDDRMGQLLVREGKINSEQLADCRRQVSSSGRRMGEILVDLGYLKPRELLPAVRQHLEDIFYSLFAWTSGSYDAMPEQAIEERIRLSRHPAALIVEGIRRKYDAERLEECFGGKATVVVVDQSEKLSSVISATELSKAENQAIGFFDGEHSVEDIALKCGLEALRVAQLAHAWVCLGVAHVVERSAQDRADRPKVKAHLVGETDLEIDRKRVLAKHMLVQEADYFQLLGVRPDASAFEIRRAYESAMRYFCIESFPLELQDELAKPLQEITEVIDEAYTVLSDDRVRNSYRANLQ